MALWTEERIDQVRNLAATGMSASQIAAQIGGVTRNSVVGIGHRRGFRFLGDGGGSANCGPREKKPRKPKPPEDYRPRDGMLTLMELEFDSCRMIFGDVRFTEHRYCGQKTVDGYSWCHKHFGIVYRPPEDRNAAG